MKVDWTPAMQAWLDEVVSRMPEQLTVRQLDIIQPLARQVAHVDQAAA
jgi:hypothetical protein